mmetsp:Transcript_19279/g.44821  ORF Transcript_19279/g.44821 Transcript_19279/m.44821 type:complete len:135 (+) Transcript_19279:425-829(+)
MALRNYLLNLVSDCAETNETIAANMCVTIVSDNSTSSLGYHPGEDSVDATVDAEPGSSAHRRRLRSETDTAAAAPTMPASFPVRRNATTTTTTTPERRDLVGEDLPPIPRGKRSSHRRSGRAIHPKRLPALLFD